MRTSLQTIRESARSSRHAIGVDIGGTNTAVGLLDESGTLHTQVRFPTNAMEGVQAFVDRLVNVIAEVRKDSAPTHPVQAIGIACPAVNSRTGVVENPANLGWGTLDLASMIREHVDLPIALLNDGDAALLGEMRFGVARDLSNVVMITLGTGLGAGIVSDGELVRGKNGTSGEIGHILVSPQGRVCACGRMGCAETYISATGVCRTVTELLAHHTMTSPLRYISAAELNAKMVSELAAQGDEISRLAFDITGGHLGRLLANLAAIFDPEAIVLSGGLMHAGSLLLDPAVRAFQENVMERYKKSVTILLSRLHDGEASILGAGSYALQTATNQKAVKELGIHSGE